MIRSENDKIPALLLSLLLLLFFAYYAWLSDTCYEGGDNYIHYRFARYSWKYPHLLLDHWGKPVYTLLLSPFAQFGFKAAKMFICLCGVMAGYFTYLSAKELGYKFPLASIIVLLFSPIYFVMLNSVFTEIVFSLFIILSVYLFLKNRYVVAALLLSFSPLVRSEGAMFIALAIVLLFTKKQYKTIPVLFVGTVVYSLVGWKYYGDLLWLIHMNPYTGAKDIYGSGDLFHFLSSTDHTYGFTHAILIAFGSGMFIVNILNISKLKNYILSVETLFVFAPMAGFIAVHSYLWWKGEAGSVGELRVLSCVMPLCALVSMKALSFLFSKLQSVKTKNVLFIILVSLLVHQPFKVLRLPYSNDPPQQLVKEACQWIVASEYAKNKIYYYDPVVLHFLERDPYDLTSIQELLPDPESPEKGLHKGDIVFWDAHFSPNEGRLPLVNLRENTGFKLIKRYSPKESFTVLGGYNYEVYLFQKL